LLNLDHVALWEHAFETGHGDWDALFDGYTAAVDWPACRFWRELADLSPGASIILSTRSTAEEWWSSAERTVFASMRRGPLPGLEQWWKMMTVAMLPFEADWSDKGAAIAAYEASAGRLVEWNPSMGWGPLCAALGVAEPDEPFPHLNTTKDFRELAALDDG
jgi:hypothetical protein